MKMKIAVVTFVLSVTPAIAFASCSGGYKATTASECAGGQMWDATVQACVDVVNS